MEADKKYLGHNIFFIEAIIPKTVLLARTYTINIIARHIGGIKSIMQENNTPGILFTFKCILKNFKKYGGSWVATNVNNT